MRTFGWAVVCMLAGVVGLMMAASNADERPLMRDVEREALEEAVGWPNPDVATILTLAGRFIATGRNREGYVYFRTRAEAVRDRALFIALEGFFQARSAGDVFLLRRSAWVNAAVAKLDRAVSRDPGVPRYFRGLVLAELPARFQKADAAVADLQWVLDNKERFPVGLRRSVHRGLARAYTTLGRDREAKAALERSGFSSLDPSLPIFTTDAWVTAKDGFRFRPPRLVEMAPRVYVAQGYDFADIGFVLTEAGVVAIDAGTTETTARAALDAFRQVSTQPITHVLVTHAHWDHIGGLAALVGPNTTVVAQAKFGEELRVVNNTGVPFRYFFGAKPASKYELRPGRVVERRETLMIDGTEFALYPVSGAETADALLIHVPAAGVVFVGDTFMPYLGAPFLPEGSPEALFENIALIRSLHPRQLIHGHPPLTELFTIEAMPAFETAMRELHERVIARIAEGRTLVDIVHENILPASLREHSDIVLRYLVMRDNFIKRVYLQRTGYWKPDGEGLEVVAPREWAAALDLLAGGREDAFVTSAGVLLARGDHALALQIVQMGQLAHPGSSRLDELRRRALDGLRARNQQLNPFKFIIYSEWAGTDLRPAQ
jgi:glyoxylase-like metal-dependent hydrolase (beta-lactamase superfamily II)